MVEQLSNMADNNNREVRWRWQMAGINGDSWLAIEKAEWPITIGVMYGDNCYGEAEIKVQDTTSRWNGKRIRLFPRTKQEDCRWPERALVAFTIIFLNDKIPLATNIELLQIAQTGSLLKAAAFFVSKETPHAHPNSANLYWYMECGDEWAAVSSFVYSRTKPIIAQRDLKETPYDRRGCGEEVIDFLVFWNNLYLVVLSSCSIFHWGVRTVSSGTEPKQRINGEFVSSENDFDAAAVRVDEPGHQLHGRRLLIYPRASQRAFAPRGFSPGVRVTFEVVLTRRGVFAYEVDHVQPATGIGLCV